MALSRKARKAVLSADWPARLLSDHEANQEGKAIDRMKVIGPIPPCLLNRTYRQGQGLSGLFRSGKKYRRGGSYNQ